MGGCSSKANPRDREGSFNDKWIEVACQDVADNAHFFHGAIQLGIRRFWNPDESFMSKVFSKHPDVYVAVFAGANVVMRTSTRSCENALFEEFQYSNVAQRIDFFRFCVFQDNLVHAPEYHGEVKMSALELFDDEKQISAGEIDKTLKFSSGSFAGFSLTITMRFFPLKEIPNALEVPCVYFKPTKGNSLTLYSNAECVNPINVKYSKGGEKLWKAGRCWRDLFHSIVHAKKFIFIQSWAFWPDLVLVREEKEDGSGVTLGELLKSKAKKEKVDVRIVVWDDPTTHSWFPFMRQDEGLFKTHDEYSRKYFDKSRVKFFKIKRKTELKRWWSFGDLKEHFIESVAFSHHEKCFIMDQDGGSFISYVGGIDPTTGRFDDGNYSLFRTLETVHKDDFMNNCFKVTAKTGPREPWHDLHARIEGPAVADMLKAFLERWRKQVNAKDIDGMVSLLNSPLSEVKDDSSPWTLQSLRSVDANSVEFDPKITQARIGCRSSRHANSFTLSMERGIFLDDSFQKGYVHHIRRAREFIYIENQFFIGGSQNWSSDRDAAACNTVATEVALKICQKIEEGSRFAAYIVIPLYPEGDAHGLPVQEQLFWTMKTIQMMYHMITQTLKKTKTRSLATDYLNFFCLGKRESTQGSQGSMYPDIGHPASAVLLNSRRMQIYVHAKGMVVDDEVLVVGSGNLNERSMNGMRDTEIGVAAYQEDHLYTETKNGSGLPQGEVSGFRLYLWTQHTRRFQDCFRNPKSLECVETVNKIASDALDAFLAEQISESSSFLMKYPIGVDPETGEVQPLIKLIPDTEGNLVGKRTHIKDDIPSLLTT